MVRHLDHEKGAPCDVCDGEAAAKGAGSALLNMLKGPKELLYEDAKRQVTRIPGTSITISRRRKS